MDSNRASSMPSKAVVVLRTFVPAGEKILRAEKEERNIEKNNQEFASILALASDLTTCRTKFRVRVRDELWDVFTHSVSYKLDVFPSQEVYDGDYAKTSLYGGSSPVLGENSHDEEIFVHKDCVLWSAEGVLRKRFTFELPVLQACFCHLDVYGESPVLCILQKHLLLVYRLSGQLAEAPFQEFQRFKAMWPLSVGLLLEGEGGNYGIMTDPLEELLPVIAQTSVNSGYEEWNGEKIVWATNLVPYVITFNKGTGYLSVWKVDQSTSRSGACDVLYQTPGPTGPISPFPSPRTPQQPYQRRMKIRTSTGELSPEVFLDTPGSTGSGGGFTNFSSLVLPTRHPPIFRLEKQEKLNEGDIPDEACLASDDSKNLSIAVLCKNVGRLKVFTIGNSYGGSVHCSMDRTGVRAIASVTPFAGVGNHGDTYQRHLMVLHESEMYIYKGGDCFCEVKLPRDVLQSLDPPEADDDSQSEMDTSPVRNTPRGSGFNPFRRVGDHASSSLQQEPVPAGLRDAIGNRVTIDLAGGKSVRCLLPFAPAYPLPALAMDALKHTLQEKNYRDLYGDWLQQPDTGRNLVEKDWSAFCMVFHQHMSCAPEAADLASLPDVLSPPRRSSQMPLTQESDGKLLSVMKTKYGKQTPYTGGASRQGAWELDTDIVVEQQSERHWRWLRTSQRAEELGFEKMFRWLSPPPSNSRQMDVTFGRFSTNRVLLDCLIGLHSIYEDFKLDLKKWPNLRKFAKFLIGVAVHLGADKYIDHYARDMGPSVVREVGLKFPINQKMPKGEILAPADIHRSLLATLNGENAKPWIPQLVSQESSLVSQSKKLLEVYGQLAVVGEECANAYINSGMGADCRSVQSVFESGSREVIELLVRQGWDLQKLESLPFGVALPIQEVIQRSKDRPPTDWPIEAYVLIGRDDIVTTLTSSRTASTETALVPVTESPESSGVGQSSLDHRSSAAPLCSSSMHSGNGRHLGMEIPSRIVRLPYNRRLWIPTAEVQEQQNSDGTTDGEDEPQTPAAKDEDDGIDEVITSIGPLRFGRDNRLYEVCKLLTSATPMQLKIADAQEGDPELQQKYQMRLMGLAVRAMALPVGRGAFVLNTVLLQPTEELHIPELCLSGRVPGRKNVIRLDLMAQQPAADGGAAADLTAWPEFHNGVAAGLKLNLRGEELTRSWLVYNRPQTPTYTKAGVILAVGLTGNLDKLTNPDVTRYLGIQHTATTIAVLLGLGASRLGTMEHNANTTMFLHLPHRHPQNIPEVELSSHIQAANLMAIGLLYKGTAHRMITQLMLEEIGRRPGKNTTVDIGHGFVQGGVTTDREGYALASGFALGLVNLGQGGQGYGLEDLRIEDTLRYYMVGGNDPRPGVQRIRKHVFTPQGLEGLLGPGGTSWDPELGDMELVRDLPGIPGSLSRENTNRGLDGDHAQVQGTSQVVLEGEMVNLDVTSPAATMALAMMYIRTNNADIAATFKIPQSEFELDYVRPDFIMLRVLGRALVMWEDIAPSWEWIRKQLPAFMSDSPEVFFASARSMEQVDGDRHVDEQVVAQARVNAIAGACLAIGLKYAGTADNGARSILHEYVLKFLAFKGMVPDASDPAYLTYGKLDKQALETVINTCALALSVVMAGTGHLETFKLLRGLRKRLHPGPAAVNPNAGNMGGLRYGNHMAIGMAIGFLFMGGGSVSFRTDNMAVAALLIALFPKFPQTTMDQRCHLQAFRHMYVLATEARCVTAVDVDTKEAVCVPIKITLSTESFARPTVDDSKAPKHDPPNAASPNSTLCLDARVLAGQHDKDEVEDEDEMMVDEASSLVDGMSAEGKTEKSRGSGDGDELSFGRETPCLLPQESEISSIEVCGPRYWSQLIDRSANSALPHVYKKLQIFVKKKSGMLSYTQDPLGVRTLLSSAFHRSLVIPGPQGGYDLVNLCATYATDYSIMGFAQMFCSTGQPPRRELTSLSVSTDHCEPPSATQEFHRFCRSVLYECITQEKPELLYTHIALYCLVHGMSWKNAGGGERALGDFQWMTGHDQMLHLWNLKFCREYYEGNLGLAFLGQKRKDEASIWEVENVDPEAETEDSGAAWLPLLDQTFLSSLWVTLSETWEKFLFTSADLSAMRRTLLREYMESGTWGQSRGHSRGDSEILENLFGAFLALNDVPCHTVIREAVEKVKRHLERHPEHQKGALLLLAESLPGVPHSTVRKLAKCFS